MKEAGLPGQMDGREKGYFFEWMGLLFFCAGGGLFHAMMRQNEKSELLAMNPALSKLVFLTSSRVRGPYMSQILLLRTSMPFPGCCDTRCQSNQNVIKITLSLLHATLITVIVICSIMLEDIWHIQRHGAWVQITNLLVWKKTGLNRRA